MTQRELDTIPEYSMFGKRLLRVENGMPVYAPVYHPLDLVYVKETDPMCVWDDEGRCWMLGKKDGQRVKYRNPSLDRWEAV